MKSLPPSAFLRNTNPQSMSEGLGRDLALTGAMGLAGLSGQSQQPANNQPTAVEAIKEYQSIDTISIDKVKFSVPGDADSQKAGTLIIQEALLDLARSGTIPKVSDGPINIEISGTLDLGLFGATLKLECKILADRPGFQTKVLAKRYDTMLKGKFYLDPKKTTKEVCERAMQIITSKVTAGLRN